MKYKINKGIILEDFDLNDLDNMSRTEYPAAEANAYAQKENMIDQQHEDKTFLQKLMSSNRNRYNFPKDQTDPTTIFKTHQSIATNDANNHMLKGSPTDAVDIQQKVADGINARNNDQNDSARNSLLFGNIRPGNDVINQAVTQDQRALTRAARFK